MMEKKKKKIQAKQLNFLNCKISKWEITCLQCKREIRAGCRELC